MQTFYHQQVVGSEEPAPSHNASHGLLAVDAGGSATALSSTADDGVDLEWEHQYDVGAGATTPTLRSTSRGEVWEGKEMPPTIG